MGHFFALYIACRMPEFCRETVKDGREDGQEDGHKDNKKQVIRYRIKHKREPKKNKTSLIRGGIIPTKILVKKNIDIDVTY